MVMLTGIIVDHDDPSFVESITFPEGTSDDCLSSINPPRPEADMIVTCAGGMCMVAYRPMTLLNRYQVHGLGELKDVSAGWSVYGNSPCIIGLSITQESVGLSTKRLRKKRYRTCRELITAFKPKASPDPFWLFLCDDTPNVDAAAFHKWRMMMERKYAR